MKKILLSGIAGMMILLAGCNAGGTSNSLDRKSVV